MSRRISYVAPFLNDLMPSIAFFDVDNTLMKGYSGFYTTRILIQRKIMKKRRLPLALFYRLISPFYKGDLRRLYEIAIADMAGTRLDDILRIGRDCFERWMKPLLYREGIEAIGEHKRRREPVYLVTSGPSMVIRALAEFLGVDGQFSCGPVIENGILTDRVRMPIYYREGKVVAAEEAVGRHGVRWEDCYYYADSEDDLFLLRKVGHPRLVNPGKRLRRIALEQKWPILTWRSMNDNSKP